MSTPEPQLVTVQVIQQPVDFGGKLNLKNQIFQCTAEEAKALGDDQVRLYVSDADKKAAEKAKADAAAKKAPAAAPAKAKSGKLPPAPAPAAPAPPAAKPSGTTSATDKK